MKDRSFSYKKIIIGIIGLIIIVLLYNLFSKSTPEATPSNEKTPFFIKTLVVGGKNETGAKIEKRGKVAGSSDITVTALVPGRVNDIIYTIGDTINKNQLTIQLRDTYGSYQFASQRAGLSIDSAKNTYEQQVENLEKQLQDAQLAYDKAALQSSTVQDDARQQLEKAKYDLENLSDKSGSSTDLQVQKLEKDLEKASFDYETKIKSDEQTLANFVATAKNIASDITLLTQDVLYETDKILGVTDLNKSFNDAYESNLSARNTAYLFTARDVFLSLQRQEEQLTMYDATSITIDNVEQALTDYINFLQPVNQMLDVMENVLINTVDGAGLSQTELDILKTQFDGYQAKAQGTITSVTAQINSINSFLSTYKEQQTSLAKSVDLLSDQINITKKSLADAEFSSQVGFERTQISAESNTENALIGIKSAQSALDYVRNTKNSTLKSIENSRKQAEVQYAEAVSNLEKFSVKTPVDGTIADIFVDLGQDVSPGTPLFRVVSDQHEIEINLLVEEFDLIEVGQEVIVRGDDGTEVNGTIVSKSDAGDQNGNFKAIIQLSENTLKIGTYADVSILIGTKTVGIPVNSVHIVDNGVGEIFLRDGTEVIKKTVELGQLLGDQVEVKTSLPNNAQLILTNMERYDPKVHAISEIEQ